MASDLPPDILYLIAETLSFRGVVAVLGVCQQWRRAIKDRPQLINKFLPNHLRDIDQTTAISKILSCPLRRGTLELVPTWQLEPEDLPLKEPGFLWPSNEKRMNSTFEGSIVRREGHAPKFFASENDDISPLERFTYGDGMVAWQATPLAVVVDDLTNGYWHTFESPPVFDNARIASVSRKIAVLEKVNGQWDQLEHPFLVYDLATGCHASYRMANSRPEDNVKIQVQDEHIALCCQRSNDLETHCVQLRMTINHLGQGDLQVVQKMTVRGWANAMFNDSGDMVYTVHHEKHTIIVVTGYRHGQQCSRYVTEIPQPAAPHAAPPPSDRTPRCRRVDSNGTWQIQSEIRFIPQTKTSLYFNVASCRFYWQHVPDELGPNWDGYFDQPVCWNGWAYSYDFTPNDYGYNLTPISRLTAQACSDLLPAETVYSDWTSEDQVEHRLPEMVSVDVVWQPSLSVDDEFLVFPTTQGAGYCVMQFGEKKDLYLREGKHYMADRGQGILGEQAVRDSGDGHGDENNGTA